jgi:hypothetical protein
LQTITVTASRGSSLISLSEMELLVGSAIVVVVLAWIVLSHIRRDRQDPHA